jgi:hypothetical protein
MLGSLGVLNLTDARSRLSTVRVWCLHRYIGFQSRCCRSISPLGSLGYWPSTGDGDGKPRPGLKAALS